MIAPIKWLLKYTDVKADSPEEIHNLGSELTMSGSKVEAIVSKGADIQNVLVGYCFEVKDHENSDHLHVCQLDMGTGEPVQIVTGAPNIRENAHIPVALNGAIIAEGRKITSGKLRGVTSNGMMCSFEEIGLDCNDYNSNNDGVMILEDVDMFKGMSKEELDKFIGKNIINVLGADDTVIEFEITSNRADCFSILGLSRETAITMGGKFSKPIINVVEASDIKTSDEITVDIQAPDLCPRYCAWLVKDVKIEPSPKWMRDELAAAGVRPINNIVDITNYVMLEYGQPMHAFDRRDIAGSKIVVRRAEDGEVLTTLDEQDRTLNSNMLVIADSEKAIGLAGIMGGLNSEIKDDTTEIVFEAAIFDAVTIRRGAKSVGLRTESSSRFEKGLDTVTCYEAICRAVSLVNELGAGKVCTGAVDIYSTPKAKRKVPCSVDAINTFIGIDATRQKMEEILTNLECEVNFDEGYVIPPSFREDLICQADIAEEVARFYGYNNIKSSLLASCENTIGGKTREQKLRDNMRMAMTGMGYNEMLTFSFGSPSYFDKLCLPADSPLRDAVIISNPLGEDYSVMRTTMMPSILETMAHNHAHRVEEAKAFEISYVYIKTPDYPKELPEHRELITFGFYGAGDFFALKSNVEALLAKLRIAKYSFEPITDDPMMHPGRSAELIIGGKKAGILGQIHPQVAANFECPEETYVAIIRTADLFKNAIDIPKSKELPKYPAVTRDIAVLIDRNVPAGHVEQMIRERGSKALESCRLFDCYMGDRIEADKKSLAYSLAFRDETKTLTDDDVNRCMKKILSGLEYKFGAVLRDK